MIITLPDESRLTVSSSRQVGDPSSFFVDLAPGEFQRVDFIVEPPEENKEDVFARVKKLNMMLDDTDMISEPGSQVKANFVGPLQPTVKNNQYDSKKEKMPLTKKVVKKINYKQAKKGTWLWPKGNISLDGRFMVVIPASIKSPTLYVNDEAVAIEQLGEQIVNKKTRSQVLSWYGIKLKKGKNKLEVKGINEVKKLKVVAKNTFIYPSHGVALKLSAAKKELVADSGKSNLPIKIEVLDEQGNIAKGTYFVTLEATQGSWLEEDIQKSIAGHQVKIQNGQGIVHLKSSNKTGKVYIRATSDEMQSDIDITQITYMRPLIASGYLNITVHNGHLNDEGIFDTGLLSGRSKIFMKGKIKGDFNLTLSFDSNKDINQEASFQNTFNQSYYPARGDASLRNREAKSQDKLFIKVEKDRSNIMWGDFELDKDNHYDLAKVQRTLTGAKAHFENDKTKMEIFSAPQANKHFTEEFPGNGTSMQYQLAKSDIVVNSELIELIIYSKNSNSLVLSTQTLNRSEDYTLDPYTGYLSFHRIIPAYDDNQNPIYIRVNYNYEDNNNDNYLVAGARIQHKLGNSIVVGGSVTQDQQAETGGKIVGAYLHYQPSNNTQMTLSSAHMSHNNGANAGSAHRLKIHKKWKNKAQTDLVIAHADENFTNNSGGIRADHREAKLIHSQKLKNNTTLKIQGQHNEALSTHTMNQSLGMIVEKNIANWKVMLGGRRIASQSTNEIKKVNTAIIGANRNIRLFGQHGRISGEYEQDLADSSHNHITANTEISLGKKSSIYAYYDEGSDFLGTQGYGLDQRRKLLTAGIKTTMNKDMELYSEYRSSGLLDTPNAESAVGVRGSHDIEKGLSITPTLEVIKNIIGNNTQNSVAASVSLTDVRDKNHKKFLRIEGRRSDTQDYMAIRGDYTARLDDDWTTVIRDDLRIEKSSDNLSGSNIFTIGAAKRPMLNGKLNSQYVYQWKKNQDSVIDKENIHLLSTHQNYQVNNKLDLGLRMGMKYKVVRLDNEESQHDSLVFDIKSRYELNKHFDIDIHGGILSSDGFDETRYAMGVGANIFLSDYWRLGIGYNFKGFEDKDLDPSKQNADGFFVKLQLKIHEDLFNSMAKKESRLLTARKIPTY